MNRHLPHILSRLLPIFIAVLTFMSPGHADAFPLSTYADSSALATGRWVKISVSTTGLQLISTADLRSWGFSDPTKVKVFGYGGQRIPDMMTQLTFVDDVPQVQSVMTSRGLLFYGRGPEGWAKVDNGSGVTMYERVKNPYTDACYYYLSDVGVTPREISLDDRGLTDLSGDDIATTFLARLWHEQDLVTIHETGHDLYGEDFRFTPSQSLTFNLPDLVETPSATPNAWMRCRFFANVPSKSTYVTYTVNNAQLPRDERDRVPGTSGSYNYGDTCLSRKAFNVSGNRLTLGITHNPAGNSVQKAHLDRVDINYLRSLRVPSDNYLLFSSDATRLRLDNATASTVIWDVTDPSEIFQVDAATVSNARAWVNEYYGDRDYVAWNENGRFESPRFVGAVTNQNLHALDVPDMLIITVDALRAQAEKIADLHRNASDSLKVHVVTTSQVYNEFSSGSPDVGAFRRILKMFYDRGLASPDGKTISHCMLIGRPSFDHRKKTAGMKNVSAEILPIWQTDVATNDNTSFCSDDIIAMLEDNTGNRMANHRLNVGVGRLPVSSTSDADRYVEKLTGYMQQPPAGDWVNNILMLADDRNGGIHMDQSEEMINNMISTPNGEELFVNKVYVDAYPKTNGVVQIARDIMYKRLNEGVMWWNYVGHASRTSWTEEKMLTPEDLNNLYLTRLPILYAATCDFGRWDSSEECGAETMLLQQGGGVIAAVTATRPVYINSNGNLTASVGYTMMQLHDDGTPFTIGEIIRHAKNNTYNTVQTINDSNRLRYVMFGDPAIRLPLPANRIFVDTINGVDVDPDNEEQAIIMAHQQATLTGRVVNWQGKPIEDFNGTIQLSLYDAEKSVTTLGRGDDKDPGKELTFEQQGDLLYTGRATVTNGNFTAKIAMPSDVAQNFRNAAVNIIAIADDGRRASGINRNFYVYGYDETADVDTVPPVIEYAYLNHESFKDGDAVNPTPMLIASVKDDVGINLSSAGIGHQMTVRIDGSDSHTDVSRYFTPAEDGSPAGTIAYPCSELQPGNHTMTLRVWDTSNNPSSATISFFVSQGISPTIFDVYTDTNPASDRARFYVRHNRPDASLKVTIEVFNLMGRLEWSSTVTGRSDMFTSAPVTWDLTDGAGRRVPRGIYLYRATVSADGEEATSSMSKRIAVTAY